MRLCNASSPLSRNFELKTLDGTANPYLALAAVLGSGLDGIVNDKELSIKECGGEKSAAQLGEKGRDELGIRDRLPLTWEEARLKFEKSTIVERVFGEDFKRKYLSVNKVGVFSVLYSATFDTSFKQTLKERMTVGLQDDEEFKLLVENY